VDVWAVARLCLAGFSRKLVEVLRGVEAEFSTFNILADEEVRQAYALEHRLCLAAQVS
jgi:glutaredoxin-related protein